MGLRDRLQMEVENWVPEEGDELVGEVVSVATRLGYKDVPYQVYVVHDTELKGGGLFACHAFHTTIRKDLSRVRVGDEVGIKYLGRRETRGGNEFEAYRVLVEPSTPLADPGQWDIEDTDAPEDAPF